MELMDQLKVQAEGLDKSIFEGEVEVGETLLSPEEEDLQKGELIKRQIIDKSNFELGIYPPKSQFLDHLRANWKHAQRIKRSQLRVNGNVVHDEFGHYLYDTKVRLDSEGKVMVNNEGKIFGFFQSSDLKAANKTPRHLFFKMADDLLPKREQSAHFNLGEALHRCLMEPTLFSRYVVEPTASKASNSGCDVHIAFWKEKLMDVCIQGEGNTTAGKERFEFVMEMIIHEQQLMPVSVAIDFLKWVSLHLENEKFTLYEGHNFENLVFLISEKMKSILPDGFSFTGKVSDDPLQIVLKQLSLKSNQTLGVSKGFFTAEPKRDLLENLKETVKLYLDGFISISNSDVFFTGLEQRKSFIEALRTACGLESVNEKEYTIIKCLEMNAKTYGNGIIYKLARHAHREVSVYLDDYDGLPLKVRPDMLQFKENIGVDAIISVKSTSSENIEKFFYDTAKYQYELSEGMYTEVVSRVTGREFRSVITIMYQTVEPWGVAVFWWKPEDIELGKHKFLQAHQTLKDTLEKGVWPGYDIYAEEGDFGVIDMALPWWAYKGLEERNQEGLGHVHSTDVE
jgi:hypothetical protein